MPTPNADDPLQTTDHAPVQEKGMPSESAEAPPSLAVKTTLTFRPKPGESRDGSSATPPESPPPVPGYEILAVLGRGGMGAVYKARHMALKRTVAIKMVLAGGHAGPGELARFRIEAEGSQVLDR